MSQQLKFKENLDYLLQLFDDESPEIQKALREEILKHSLEIILNKDGFCKDLSPKDSEKLNFILKQLHRELIYNAYNQLSDSSQEEINLEKSVFVLSYWRQPEISCLTLTNLLDKLAGEVAEEMPQSGHPLGFIDHINKVLFQRYHFRGNSADYYNPENSYLHKVIETGLGIPISLSIIYILVAKRLSFPVFGVCMPAHFILKFDNGEDEIFFDPFYGGKIYSRQTCLEYMKGFDVVMPEKVLEGCSNLEIIKRVFRNLYLNYSSHTPEPDKLEEIEQILALLDAAK
jgi:regulator of sirC expression with transglutaminase-like and TPR domain